MTTIDLLRYSQAQNCSLTQKEKENKLVHTIPNMNPNMANSHKHCFSYLHRRSSTSQTKWYNFTLYQSDSRSLSFSHIHIISSHFSCPSLHISDLTHLKKYILISYSTLLVLLCYPSKLLTHTPPQTNYITLGITIYRTEIFLVVRDSCK